MSGDEFTLPVFSLAELRAESLAASQELEENNIIVYTAMLDERATEYLAAFRTQYPDVQVNLERFTTVELAERVLEEKRNPQADVIWGLSATTLQTLAWNDLLTPYTPLALETLPEDFRDQNDPPEWVGQDVWMNALCVNRGMLAEIGAPIPSSWMDLLDPIYKDQIIFPSPGGSGTGYMTLLVFHDIFGEAALWDKLDQLDENVVTYDMLSQEACRAVANGDAAIGISVGVTAVNLRKSGADILVVFPTEGSGWDMQASALVRKFPIKPGAKTLMDYIISEDAMHHYGLHSAVTAAPAPYLVIPVGFPRNPREQLMDKEFVWASANRNRLISEWEARYKSK